MEKVDNLGDSADSDTNAKVTATAFLYFCTGKLTNLSTLKCLSIGTPNTTTFPFVPNRKCGYIRCPNI